MALSGKMKLRIALGAIALLVAFSAYEAIGVWWNYGYSKGTRTGVVRKVSVKGPPYCKYMSGEMVLGGGQPGQAADIWEFSIDDYGEKNPVMMALKEAEKTGARVTLVGSSAERADLEALASGTDASAPWEIVCGSAAELPRIATLIAQDPKTIPSGMLAKWVNPPADLATPRVAYQQMDAHAQRRVFTWYNLLTAAEAMRKPSPELHRDIAEVIHADQTQLVDRSQVEPRFLAILGTHPRAEGLALLRALEQLRIGLAKAAQRTMAAAKG